MNPGLVGASEATHPLSRKSLSISEIKCIQRPLSDPAKARTRPFLPSLVSPTSVTTTAKISSVS